MFFPKPQQKHALSSHAFIILSHAEGTPQLQHPHRPGMATRAALQADVLAGATAHRKETAGLRRWLRCEGWLAFWVWLFAARCWQSGECTKRLSITHWSIFFESSPSELFTQETSTSTCPWHVLFCCWRLRFPLAFHWWLSNKHVCLTKTPLPLLMACQVGEAFVPRFFSSLHHRRRD